MSADSTVHKTDSSVEDHAGVRIRPYYEHAGITIYHGDCREILPTLPKADLVLTDPPYGISYSPGGGGRGFASKTYTGKDLVVGDDKPFDPGCVLGLGKTILWGGNHYASRLPDSPTWLVWYKKPGIASCDFADCEIAWTNLGGPARHFTHLWNGGIRESERGVHWHPTQKPLAVIKWCLGLAGEVSSVLDPFMGSGTTLVAAKAAGLTGIGIEIEERYCEIAAKRLSQEVFDWEIPQTTKGEPDEGDNLFSTPESA